jgi:hypothetical protein
LGPLAEVRLGEREVRFQQQSERGQ